MSSIRLQAVIFSAFLFLTTNAMACMGPLAHTRIFLDVLPRETLSKDVVARVKILSIGNSSGQWVSKVQVIKPIKGATRDKIFDVLLKNTSCSQDYDVKVGDVYFISGVINSSGVFEGEWRGDSPHEWRFSGF